MLLASLLVLAISTPPTGHWCTDETGKVPAAAISEFERIAAELDSSGAGQLGLAVVSSTHGENPRAFATRVFNQWGIGHAARNDGMLLFFALDDRKSEIVVGDGIQGYQATTDRVMHDDVVAHMKIGRLDLAITRAAGSLSRFLSAAAAPPEPLAPEPEIKERSPRGWTIELDVPLTPAQVAAFDREGDSVYASGKGLLFVAMYKEGVHVPRFAERLRTQLKREDVWVVFDDPLGPLVVSAPFGKRIYEPIEEACQRIEERAHQRRLAGDSAVDITLEATHATVDLILHEPPPKPITYAMAREVEQHPGFAFGSFGVVGLLGLVGVRSWWRKRPRVCETCKFPRHRLSEETDDPHLNPGQQTEESLGSVDYDVWWCGRCNDALVLRYGKFFSSYSTCDGCGNKTASSSSVTLVEATYSHGGTVEVTETCAHCPHRHTYTRHTAQLTRDDSSSSSWSSSSSGSSFGGGSSSGGGSSGSW